MKFIYGFTLAVVTFVLGEVAFELTFRDTVFGGILPFVFITLSPLAFFGLGYFYPKSRTYSIGSTYFRRGRFDSENSF